MGEAHECVWVVSHVSVYIQFVYLLALAVDFALTEAAYTIVRLLQRFPSITLPDGEKIELAGVEKQSVTIVLRSTTGCKVNLG